MKTVAELTATDDPAWPQIQQWFAASPHRVEVLPRDGARAEAVLHALQVTTRSTLGAVAWECGGILIDHGWVRVLGSGGVRLPQDLDFWNGLMGAARPFPTEGILIVAHDVVGGLFGLDGGGLGPGTGGAYYFAPESLEWEDLGRGHSGLLQLLFSESLTKFYEHRRWTGWERVVERVATDEALLEYPPPYAAEWRDADGRRRADLHVKAVPMTELVALQFDVRAQL